MPRVAFYTIGVLREDYDHPTSRGFIDRIPGTEESAASADGFCSYSLYDGSALEPAPGFIAEDQWDRVAQTLSTWRDLESVFAFAYSGRHGEALRGRREWFLKLETPVYAIWWVTDDHQPNFAEAFERIEQLDRCGPTPQVFNFKLLFNADGTPHQLDRASVTIHRAHVR